MTPSEALGVERVTCCSRQRPVVASVHHAGDDRITTWCARCWRETVDADQYEADVRDQVGG